MKLLMTYDYGEAAVTAIQELGYEVRVVKESDLNSEDPELEAIEVLVCYDPFKRIRLTSMPSLKTIMLSSIGIDQIPVQEVLQREIAVTNNRGGYSKPMGEWIVWSLLSGLKNSAWFYYHQCQHTWKTTTDVLELTGRTIGFLGTGTIAREAAARLSGFEVRCVGLNHDGVPVEGFAEVKQSSEKIELAKLCDAVVIALPYTSETACFVDQSFLEAMKENAILINVSRGSVIDEAALIERLKQGAFRSVHLDVFDEEPLPASHPFWSMDRVFVTPHNSWVSEKRNTRRLALIIENLRRLAQNEPLLNVVDVKRGY